MADSTAALSEDKAKLLDMSLDEIIQESGEQEEPKRQVERVSKSGGIAKRRPDAHLRPAGQKKPPASRSFREWRALASQTTIFFKAGGDLAVKLYDTDVVVVKKTNDLCLSSGGFKTIETLFVINEALKAMAVKVTETNPDDKEWSVSDNSLFQPFKDMMTLKPSIGKRYPAGTCASLVNQVLTQAIYNAQDKLKQEKKKRAEEMAARPAGAPPGWVPAPGPIPYGYPPPMYHGHPPAYPVYHPGHPPPGTYPPPGAFRPGYHPPPHGAYYRPPPVSYPPPHGAPHGAQFYPPPQQYPPGHDTRGPPAAELEAVPREAPEESPPAKDAAVLQSAPHSEDDGEADAMSP